MESDEDHLIPAHTIKKGQYCSINGKLCKVGEITSTPAGKHGSAKITITDRIAYWFRLWSRLRQKIRTRCVAEYHGHGTDIGNVLRQRKRGILGLPRECRGLHNQEGPSSSRRPRSHGLNLGLLQRTPRKTVNNLHESADDRPGGKNRFGTGGMPLVIVNGSSYHKIIRGCHIWNWPGRWWWSSMRLYKKPYHSSVRWQCIPLSMFDILIDNSWSTGGGQMGYLWRYRSVSTENELLRFSILSGNFTY